MAIDSELITAVRDVGREMGQSDGAIDILAAWLHSLSDDDIPKQEMYSRLEILLEKIRIG